MNLHSWLQGFGLIAFTLLPVFSVWGFAVLWSRSRSAWALTSLLGTSLPLLGVAGMWARNFYHYSSVEVMMKDNANPDLELMATLEACVVFGFFIAAFALVGYARSLPSAAQPGAPADVARPAGERRG